MKHVKAPDQRTLRDCFVSALDTSGRETGLDDRSAHETTLDCHSGDETTLDHPFAHETPLDDTVHEGDERRDDTESVVGEDGDSCSGTHSFPKFSVSHPTFVRFHRFLCGIDGGSRTEKVAGEIVVDVSKFLRYACGPSAGPDWERLLD